MPLRYDEKEEVREIVREELAKLAPKKMAPVEEKQDLFKGGKKK